MNDTKEPAPNEASNDPLLDELRPARIGPTVGEAEYIPPTATECATGESRGEPSAPDTLGFELNWMAADPADTAEQDPGHATTELAPHGGEIGPGETVSALHGHRTTEPDANGPAPVTSKSARQRATLPTPVAPGHVILEEIARGGMGVVYKARNVRLNRLVALKMVLAGAHASPEQLERFATESQAVAQLQHPGIVQIYEVGERHGLPYFSLEFVSGGSLAHKLEGKPQPTRQAAEMVHELALAMREAHSRNIVHRDLKPANVLLTPEGRLKITDFGLAKRMDSESDMTRTGAIMGTPSYMAPEQAWGKTREIGPLSDQYALGAILYEMLVGRPPFQGATPLETLQLARTEEPVPPTRLQPKIPVDLETICLKCLQKEPAKRYGDVGVLAEDLQRFLDGKPILARPVGAAERLVRWCRRNPKVAVLTGSVAALLVIGATVSTVAAIHFDRQNGELKKANRAEQAAKVTAQNNERAAVAAKIDADNARKLEAEAHEKSKKLVLVAFEQNKKSLESLRYISILAHQRLRNFEGSQKLREELIATASKSVGENMAVIEQLSTVVRDREGSALATRTLAGIHQRNGKLMDEIGRYQEAAASFREMDRLAETMVAENPGLLDARKVLASSKATLGDFEMNRLADSKAALEHYKQNLALRREFSERNPDDNETKRGVCNALGAIAATMLKLGDPGKAREYYQEEVSLREQLAGDVAGAVESRRERAGLEEKLGDLSVALSDNPAGREHYDRSLKLREEIASQNPDLTQVQRDLLLSYKKIGTFALLQLKDAARAHSLYEKALAGFMRRLQAEPDSVVAKGDVAQTHYFVATACLRAGDRKTAFEHYQACLEIREALAADPKAKVNVIDLMIARARCGQHQRAATTAEELMKTPPVDSRDYFMYACAFALCAGGALESADSPHGKALNRHYTERAVDALHLALAKGWTNVVDVQTDPDLDPIRNDPGFAAVVADFKKASGT